MKNSKESTYHYNQIQSTILSEIQEKKVSPNHRTWRRTNTRKKRKSKSSNPAKNKQRKERMSKSPFRAKNKHKKGEKVQITKPGEEQTQERRESLNHHFW